MMKKIVLFSQLFLESQRLVKAGTVLNEQPFGTAGLNVSRSQTQVCVIHDLKKIV